MRRIFRCRICGVETWFSLCFEKRGFEGSLMRYERCSGCTSLLCTDPTWLVRAYAKANDLDDPGAPQRAKAVARLIGVLRPARRWLDYGAGRGLLANHVAAVTSYDPFRTGMNARPSQKFEGASMVEVLEHLMEPEEDLRQLFVHLESGSPLLVTTNLYDVGYDDRWPYLASEFGQHVTFPSKRGLGLLARRTGFKWPLFARPNELHPLEIHILFKPPSPPDMAELSEQIRCSGFAVEMMS